MAQIVASVRERRLKQRPVEVFFVDESHFTNEPYVQRGWFRRGRQTRTPQPAKRQSASVFGALHMRSRRFYWKRVERGTSKRFLEFLHQLHGRFAEALIVVIVDNARIHTSRLVKAFLERHDWVALEHLTPYSPEYNAIERFWQWLKAKVYGASCFATIEALIAKMRRFIRHYNEGWLTTSIRFDFASYAQIL